MVYRQACLAAEFASQVKHVLANVTRPRLLTGLQSDGTGPSQTRINLTIYIVMSPVEGFQFLCSHHTLLLARLLGVLYLELK